MTDNLDEILDECLDRISRGESLDACLADYPEYVGQLEPLLQAMLQTREQQDSVSMLLLTGLSKGVGKGNRCSPGYLPGQEFGQPWLLVLSYSLWPTSASAPCCIQLGQCPTLRATLSF